jgi:hypothetical protein
LDDDVFAAKKNNGRPDENKSAKESLERKLRGLV